MKARIKGTNIIVECIDTGISINENTGIKCKHSNGAMEVIPGDCLVELENDFDWQSFRAEAAKDILSNSLIPYALKEFSEESINIDYWTGRAIEWTDALVKKLKEKEEK